MLYEYAIFVALFPLPFSYAYKSCVACSTCDTPSCCRPGCASLTSQCQTNLQICTCSLNEQTRFIARQQANLKTLNLSSKSVAVDCVLGCTIETSPDSALLPQPVKPAVWAATWKIYNRRLPRPWRCKSEDIQRGSRNLTDLCRNREQSLVNRKLRQIEYAKRLPVLHIETEMKITRNGNMCICKHVYETKSHL